MVQQKEKLSFGLKDIIQIIIVVAAVLGAYYTGTAELKTRIGILEQRTIERDKTLEEIRRDTKSLLDQFTMLYRDYDLRRK